MQLIIQLLSTLKILIMRYHKGDTKFPSFKTRAARGDK